MINIITKVIALLGLVAIFGLYGCSKDSDDIGVMTNPPTNYSTASYESTHPQKESFEKGLVEKAQSKLQSAGYPITSIDGIMDSNTQEALKDFQRNEGLLVTGSLNEETLKELDIDFQIKEKDNKEIYSE